MKAESIFRIHAEQNWALEEFFVPCYYFFNVRFHQVFFGIVADKKNWVGQRQSCKCYADLPLHDSSIIEVRIFRFSVQLCLLHQKRAHR